MNGMNISYTYILIGNVRNRHEKWRKKIPLSNIVRNNHGSNRIQQNIFDLSDVFVSDLNLNLQAHLLARSHIDNFNGNYLANGQFSASI